MLELLGYTLLLGDEEWVVSVSSVVCLLAGKFPHAERAFATLSHNRADFEMRVCLKPSVLGFCHRFKSVTMRLSAAGTETVVLPGWKSRYR